MLIKNICFYFFVIVCSCPFVLDEKKSVEIEKIIVENNKTDIVINKEADIDSKTDVDDEERKFLVVKIGKVYTIGEREKSVACAINSTSVQFSELCSFGLWSELTEIGLGSL